LKSLGFKKVKLAELTISPYNIRKEIPEEGIEELAENIEEISMLHPLIVTPDNQIICGQRRYRALKLLGREEAWAKIVDATPVEQTCMSLAEHFQRLDPTDSDIKKALEFVYKEKKSMREIAKLIGVSPQTVSNILKMSANAKLLQKLEEKDVPVSKGREIIKAVSKAPPLTEEEIETITEIASKKEVSFVKFKEITDAIQKQLPINLEEKKKEVEREKFITLFIALPISLHKKLEAEAQNKRKIIQELIIDILKKAFNL